MAIETICRCLVSPVMEPTPLVQMLDKSALKLPVVSSNFARPQLNWNEGVTQTLVPSSKHLTQPGPSAAILHNSASANASKNPTTSYARATAPKTEDKAAAKAKLLWELSVGTIRLRDWVRYFDPYKESSSIAQVWVRIYYLPVEFWHPEVISGIGRWLGQPLKIDGTSMTEDVGHFVRMLVEIDLAQPLPETMNIDGGDYTFAVEFSYEYLPLFCTRCKITGHAVDKCRRGTKPNKPSVEVEKPEPPIAKEPEWKIVSQTKNKNHQDQENRFSALDDEGELEGDRSSGKDLTGPDLLALVFNKTGTTQQFVEEGIKDTQEKQPMASEKAVSEQALVHVIEDVSHPELKIKDGVQENRIEERIVVISATEQVNSLENLEEGFVEDVMEESSNEEDNPHEQVHSATDMISGTSVKEGSLNEHNEQSNSDAIAMRKMNGLYWGL
ncbi:uncharacterized protein LOC131023267 [Salvia miltiorrhiza]|uniref:uncharacterized protein LOC131023267 n=1 Tax=Salvia miltiorrhiza TaxID=226208 RepID=UPI0025AC45AC|nr:uncharacterized protein LOC131023267 [Salvia miltiorrhiza]